mmetsp:Transcript_18180/g.41683  ORF Transcript_18180/g.41683 Transcript_18180/m.41683 type:complete len:294 (-) Transcript_18180:155-1036(-)
MLRSQAVTAADARMLQSLCEKRLSLALLREPELLRLVLRSLFDTTASIAAVNRQALAQVLVHIYLGGNGSLDVRKEMEDAVLDAVERCNAVDERSLAAHSERLASLLSIPPVACGVLLWTHSCLTNQQLRTAFFNGECLPFYLQLLVAISTKHAHLREQVCAVLFDCLRLTVGEDSDAVAEEPLKQQLFDCVLLQFAEGSVGPALAAIEDYLAIADLSLARYGVLRLLRLVQAPFSEPFARRLVHILSRPRVCEAFCSQAVNTRAPILSVLEHIGEQHLRLSAEVYALTTQLA